MCTMDTLVIRRLLQGVAALEAVGGFHLTFSMEVKSLDLEGKGSEGSQLHDQFILEVPERWRLQ